jgi:hypothetical protein
MEPFMKKFLLSLTLLAVSAVAVAAGEVALQKAESRVSTYRGYWHNGKFEVKVANLGYQKQVAAYIKKSDGSWVDFPLNYLRSGNNNQEIWGIDFNNYSWPDTGDNVEFAIKYSVNGQTYWDNNNWANYKMPKNAGSLLGNGVNVYYGNAYDINVYAGQTTWGNSVTVRNIGYTKDVKVIYSTDGWQTTKVATATFNPYYWSSSYYFGLTNPNSLGFEEWSFSIDFGSATQVEYAFSYSVNGQTYWDNNQGRNYLSRIYRN